MKNFYIIACLILAPIHSFAKDEVLGDSEFAILTAPNIISLGRCHMGYCSWSKSISTKQIAQTKNGILIQVKLLGGTSEYSTGGDEGEEEESTGIEWNKKPHELFINCSKQKPSVGSVDNESDVKLLDFTLDGIVPGVFISGANIYFKYCHSFVEYYTEGVKEFGYRK